MDFERKKKKKKKAVLPNREAVPIKEQGTAKLEKSSASAERWCGKPSFPVLLSSGRGRGGCDGPHL